MQRGYSQQLDFPLIHPNRHHSLVVWYENMCLQHLISKKGEFDLCQVMAKPQVYLPEMVASVCATYGITQMRLSTVEEKIIWMNMVFECIQKQQADVDVSEMRKRVLTRISGISFPALEYCLFDCCRVPLQWMAIVQWKNEMIPLFRVICQSFDRIKHKLPTYEEYAHVVRWARTQAEEKESLNELKQMDAAQLDSILHMDSYSETGLFLPYPEGFETIRELVGREYYSQSQVAQYLMLAPVARDLVWLQPGETEKQTFCGMTLETLLKGLELCVICLQEFKEGDQILRCDGGETGILREDLPRSKRAERDRGCKHAVHLPCVVNRSFFMKQCPSCRRRMRHLRQEDMDQILDSRTNRYRKYVADANPESQVSPQLECTK